MISAAACRAFHAPWRCCRYGRGHQHKQTTRRDAPPARSRRGAASSRVSLTHSLARKKRCEVTNRNLVCHLVWPILVSFLARPERPVQAARRRLPHTAPSRHCLAAFARPHPLASPAASCLRDADSAASRASRPETTALAGVTHRCTESQDRLLHAAGRRRRAPAAQDHPEGTIFSLFCPQVRLLCNNINLPHESCACARPLSTRTQHIVEAGNLLEVGCRRLAGQMKTASGSSLSHMKQPVLWPAALVAFAPV